MLVQDITEHVKLDNMRKEFIADVSHELKTPLTSIMGYAETLSEMDYDKEIQGKFLNVITTGGSIAALSIYSFCLKNSSLLHCIIIFLKL